jgi:hypothetical protein
MVRHPPTDAEQIMDAAPSARRASPTACYRRSRRPDNGRLAPELPAGIARVKTAKSIDVRSGN